MSKLDMNNVNVQKNFLLQQAKEKKGKFGLKKNVLVFTDDRGLEQIVNGQFTKDDLKRLGVKLSAKELEAVAKAEKLNTAPKKKVEKTEEKVEKVEKVEEKKEEKVEPAKTEEKVEEEKVETEETTDVSEKETTEEKKDEEEVVEPNLEDLTVPDLQKIAKELEIEGADKLKKPELIAAITKAEELDDDEDL